MTFVHGKDTYISLNAVDLSAFCNDSTFGRTSDSHDVTAYGSNSHKYQGGLLDGTAEIKGTYDNTASGPRDTIEPLIGTNVTYVRRPEGTGSGRPQDSVEVLVVDYVETSPVADMVQWSAKLQLSGDVTSTNQA